MSSEDKKANEKIKPIFVPQINNNIVSNNIIVQNNNNLPDWNDDSVNSEQVNFVISVSGLDKVGKTFLTFTLLELQEYNLFGMNFKGGTIYIIDCEGSSIKELKHHYSKYANRVKIIRPKVTKLDADGNNVIDYKASYRVILNLIRKLQNTDDGFLVIDGFKFVVDCVTSVMIEKYSGVDELGIRLDTINPMEHIWKKKVAFELMSELTSLKMSVILTNKVKDETRKTEKFFEYTGDKIEDSMEGFSYYYDVKIFLEKILDGTIYRRVATIKDSRFEEKTVNVEGIRLEEPTFKKIFELLNKNIGVN